MNRAKSGFGNAIWYSGGGIIPSATSALGYVVFIFYEHIFSSWSYIGNSDRLETYLNLKIFELTNIIKLGRVPGWNEYAFMGFSIHSLPWMLPGFDPLIWIVSLFPVSHAIYAFGIISIFWYFIATLTGYFFFKDNCRDTVVAIAASILYVSSYISILRIAQVDNAFFVIALIPAGMLALKRMADRVTYGNVLAFIATASALLIFSFLQEAAYAFLLFGLYTLYLFNRTRQFGILWLASVSVGLAILIAFPRIASIAAEFSSSTRLPQNTMTGMFEIYRSLHDGLFGRTYEEAMAIHGTHVHEGLQIFTSTFVPLIVLTGLAQPRNRFALFGGALFFLVIIFASVESLQPGRDGHIIVICLWTIIAGGMIAYLRSNEQVCDPVGFFSLATAFFLAAILVAPVRKVVFYLFLQQDFLHSRLSGVASLTIVTLASLFLTRAAGGAEQLVNLLRQRWRTALACAALALAFGFVRNFIDTIGTGFVSGKFGILNVVPIVGWEIAFCVFVYTTFLLIALLSVNARRMTLSVQFNPKLSKRRTLVLALVMVAIVDAGSYVAFQIRGPQTHRYPVPFDQHNFMMAPSHAFRIPDGNTLLSVQERLQSHDYRSVFISDPRWFDTHPASFIAQFWRLRFVEGYSPAVPTRLANLPWGEHELLTRSIRFASIDRLSWKLLAFLNVKYAIAGGLEFYYNLQSLSGTEPFSAEQLALTVNPFPVVPRAFFARRIEPPRPATEEDKSSDALLTRDGTLLSSDPRAVSFVEGIEAPRDFTDDGSVNLRSEGDRLELTFAPVQYPRFLVINELYTPDWTARSDRGPTLVYAANVVMRGVVVEPGISAITMAYRSKLYSPYLVAVSALGLFGIMLLVFYIRRISALKWSAGCSTS